MYVVESYALVKEVLANPSLYSSKVSLSLLDAAFPAEEVAAIFRAGGVVWTRTLQTNDPPDHKRFRVLVEKVFNFRRVEDLDRGIRATVEDLVWSVAAGETFDAVARWAVPLPLRIISEQLGVRAADFWDFKRWSDAAIHAIGLGATREQHVHAAHCAVEFQRYFVPILADHHQRPAGSLVALIADELKTRSRMPSRMSSLLGTWLYSDIASTPSRLSRLSSARKEMSVRVSFLPRWMASRMVLLCSASPWPVTQNVCLKPSRTILAKMSAISSIMIWGRT